MIFSGTFRCEECGMPLDEVMEYHPYAACLMFRGCQDSESVRTNLQDVLEHGRMTETKGKT